MLCMYTRYYRKIKLGEPRYRKIFRSLCIAMALCYASLFFASFLKDWGNSYFGLNIRYSWQCILMVYVYSSVCLKNRDRIKKGE